MEQRPYFVLPGPLGWVDCLTFARHTHAPLKSARSAYNSGESDKVESLIKEVRASVKMWRNPRGA